VDQLLTVKGRPAGHPLTLAIKSADEAFDYVPGTSDLSRRLARRCWPGPVTLVLDDDHPDSLVRQLPTGVQKAVVPNGSIGLRVPAHPLILEVLRLLPGPLALSSANRTGQAATVTAQDVLDALQDDVQLVLDDGRCQFGQPSSVVQVDEQGITILRAGVVSPANLGRLASYLVVLVCTGNTCRSPMAELLFRQALAARMRCAAEQLDDRGVIVTSAGIAAMAGGRPAPEAVEVMADLALDLTQHVAQPLSDRLVRHADLILTMTRSHRQAIVSHWPEVAQRTELLCPAENDIGDPIGASREVYRRCAEQLLQAIQQRVNQLDIRQLGGRVHT
jgi:protein-tyrosine phosphatase